MGLTFTFANLGAIAYQMTDMVLEMLVCMKCDVTCEINSHIVSDCCPADQP